MHNLNDEQLIIKLKKEPGKRDARYTHLFSGEEGLQTTFTTTESITTPNSDQSIAIASPPALERIAQLEQQMADLTSQLSELKEMVDILSE